jgi:hypothetical protein
MNQIIEEKFKRNIQQRTDKWLREYVDEECKSIFKRQCIRGSKIKTLKKESNLKKDGTIDYIRTNQNLLKVL